MRKKIKRVACLLAACMLAVSVGACGEAEENYALKIYLPEGEMPLLHEKVAGFLDAEFEESYQIVSTNKNQNADLQYSYLQFGGKQCLEYTIRVSEDKYFDKYFDLSYSPRVEMDKYSVNLRILKPNTQYWVKVMSARTPSVCSRVETFKTEDCVVRTLDLTDNWNGPRNVRDVGGYTTADGAKIKYGMIYRGMYLNQRAGESDSIKLRDYGRYLMKDCLGIKSEVDLRQHGIDDVDRMATEQLPQTENMISAELPYYKYTLLQYDDLWSTQHQELCEEGLRNFFALLADETQYPIYVHCNQGADRTGTIVYLLHGLLGVAYEDATKDFELTSFSAGGLRLRDDEQPVVGNHIRYGYMHKKIMTYGDTYQSAVEAYLKSIGVTADQIGKIRALLLETE